MAEQIQIVNNTVQDARITLTNPSVRTAKERNKIAGLLDDFATFYWANTDMFANFGAFIINEKKGSLKLYNGASFQNSYSKPQFQDGYTNLTGVTFNTQTISFTIGIYWISIEDYRVLINFLHPYKIDMLSFSFEKTYGYFCKLQGIKDSTKWIVGQEDAGVGSSNNNLQYSAINSGNTGGARYYTELTLTFDIIGAPCAKQIEPIYLTTDISTNITPPVSDTLGATWDWSIDEVTRDDTIIKQTLLTLDFGTPVNPNFISDLDYPFEITFPSLYVDLPTQSATMTLQATLQYNDQAINTQLLYKIGLKNIDRNSSISLTYNSERGVIYWKIGNQSKILNLLSTQLNGQRILEFIDIYSFMWPGQLNFANIKDCHLMISLIADNICLWQSNTTDIYPKVEYSAQRRTNVI